MTAIDMVRIHNESQMAHSEKRLGEIVDWIVRDVAALDEPERGLDLKLRASMLISILGGSLMTDLRTEYGRYCQLLSDKAAIEAAVEVSHEA